jgi:glycosyltransferase involved in cell wall biosynthesis
MKIDLLHYSAPPVVGGVESVLAHHARLMADAGHAVRLLAGRGETLDDRIPFIHIPLADSRHADILAVKGELDQGRLPGEFEALTALLAAQLFEITADTDVLIAHNVCSLHKNLPLTVALYRLHQSRPALHLILWHHDLAWTASRYRPELHQGYPWDLLRRDWPSTTQVVVSALRRKELCDLLGVPPERVHVVPNGLDLQRFLKLDDRTMDLVARLDLLSAAPLLLLPVRITRRKNIELALRLLAELRLDFPQTVLVVTGPLGPHNPSNVKYYEKLLSLRHELGLDASAHLLAELSSEYLPDSVIADFYRLADALLLPSREEGFGIPILEAAVAGLPIFCADIPSLRELAGEQATYFDPDADPAEIASAMNGWLSGPVYELRVRVRSGYTWQRLYRQHIEPLLTLREA